MSNPPSRRVSISQQFEPVKQQPKKPSRCGCCRSRKVTPLSKHDRELTQFEIDFTKIIAKERKDKKAEEAK